MIEHWPHPSSAGHLLPSCSIEDRYFVPLRSLNAPCFLPFQGSYSILQLSGLWSQFLQIKQYLPSLCVRFQSLECSSRFWVLLCNPKTVYSISFLHLVFPSKRPRRKAQCLPLRGTGSLEQQHNYVFSLRPEC